MKVKKVISEEMMSLPELREVLIAIRDQRAGGDSIDHADSLGKCDPVTAKALVDELNGLEKIRPEIAYRIVNIMPESRDELRAIYAKERYTLLPEDLDQILDILRQHA